MLLGEAPPNDCGKYWGAKMVRVSAADEAARGLYDWMRPEESMA